MSILKKPRAKRGTKDRRTKLEQTIAKFPTLFTDGRVLVIDPSSGSSSSMPGYAEFRNGKLVDSGTIQIPYSKKVHRRLRYLKECLERDFSEEKYDVLVMESLSIMQSTKRRAMGLLLESVGVFLAVIDSEEVAYVAPASWHKYARDKYGVEFIKSDENDAIMMGELCMQIALKYIGGNEDE
jgi:hypothetical protein